MLILYQSILETVKLLSKRKTDLWQLLLVFFIFNQVYLLSDYFATICDELSIIKYTCCFQWLHSQSKRESIDIEH